MISFKYLAPLAFTLLASATTAFGDENQTAIDACIDALMSSGKAAPGGEVLRSSFSQAGTEVILRDGSDQAWRCIAYSDGSVGVLEPASADQVQEAANTPSPADYQQIVHLKHGKSSARLSRALGPGDAFQYVLGARNLQFLHVQISDQTGAMYYTIRNPDGTLLLEGVDASLPYLGQLWQTGDHIIEVVNQASNNTNFVITFEIK